MVDVSDVVVHKIFTVWNFHLFQIAIISLYDIFTDLAFYVYFYYKVNFHYVKFSLIVSDSENIENVIR